MNFHQLLEEWRNGVYATSVCENTLKLADQQMNNYILPVIGHLDIEHIKSKMLFDILKNIEEKAPSVAKRICQRIDNIYSYANIMGYCHHNPTHKISDFLNAKKSNNHHAHILNERKLSCLLKTIDKLEIAHPVSRVAFWVIVYTATRCGEVCKAKKNEFDLNTGVWVIPAERTKTRTTQTVILSKQVIKMLRQEFKRTEHSEWAFPSPHSNKDGHISTWTPLYLIRLAKYQGDQTIHGFRHIFSTFAHNANFNSDAIELSLAHKISGIKGVYNHADMRENRKALMRWWAEQVDKWRCIQ